MDKSGNRFGKMTINKDFILQNFGFNLFNPLMQRRNELASRLTYGKPLVIYFNLNSKIEPFFGNEDLYSDIIRHFFNEDEILTYSNQINNISKRKRLIGVILVKLAVLTILKSYEVKNLLPSQIVLKKNRFGMPFIKLKNIPTPLDIFISITHKDNWNLAAAGLNMIGVDIERVRRFSSSLSKKIFTENEIKNLSEILNHLNDYENGNYEDLAFTSMFSIKESVSKALGYGLRMDFRGINIVANDSIIKIKLKRLEFQNLNFKVFLYSSNNHIYSLVENLGGLNSNPEENYK